MQMSEVLQTSILFKNLFLKSIYYNVIFKLCALCVQRSLM